MRAQWSPLYAVHGRCDALADSLRCVYATLPTPAAEVFLYRLDGPEIEAALSVYGTDLYRRGLPRGTVNRRLARLHRRIGRIQVAISGKAGSCT